MRIEDGSIKGARKSKSVYKKGDKYECEECQISFTDDKSLKTHLKSHNCGCSVCYKYFSSAERLQEHFEAQHKDSKFDCPICTASFNRKGSFDYHMKALHTNDSPITCDVCGAVCYKHNYKIHKMKHLGKKVYQCDVCKKEFMHASSYIRHQTSHTNERNFRCNVCGKSFLQNVHLLKHKKVHLGKKEFTCKICGRAYHESYYFKKHLKEMHSSQGVVGEDERSEHVTLVHEVGNNVAANIVVNVDSNSHAFGTNDTHLSDTVYTDNNINDDEDDNFSGNNFEDYIDEVVSSDSENNIGIKENDNNYLCETVYDSKDFTLITTTTSTTTVVTAASPIQQVIKSEPNISSSQSCPKCGVLLSSNQSEIDEHMETHRKFFCTFCCKLFRNSGDYTKHMSVHSENIEIRCPLCANTYNDEESFAKHKTMHHREEKEQEEREEKEKLLSCEFCDRLFSKRDLDLHMTTHASKIQYQCGACGKRFVNGLKYQRHIESHDTERKYQCDICKRRYQVLSQYTRHMKWHAAKKKYVCRVCKRSFYDPQNLAKHMLRLHNIDMPFSCEKCEENFAEETIRDQHVSNCVTKAKTNDESKRKREHFECEHCGKVVYSHDDIVDHMMEHSSIKKDYFCKSCSKIFKKRSVYEKHLRQHMGDKPFECDICKKRYASKRSVVRHKITHMAVKPFHCRDCNKRFAYRNDLRVHLLLHDNKDLFRCTICDKTFLHAVSLARHNRGHLGEKNFRCQICSKDFLQSCHLQRHLMKHSNDRPFKCKICDKRFIVSYVYRRHMVQVHSSETPFLCEKCGEAFADEDARDEHFKRHEGDNSDDEKDKGNPDDNITYVDDDVNEFRE